MDAFETILTFLMECCALFVDNEHVLDVSNLNPRTDINDEASEASEASHASHASKESKESKASKDSAVSKNSSGATPTQQHLP